MGCTHLKLTLGELGIRHTHELLLAHLGEALREDSCWDREHVRPGGALPHVRNPGLAGEAPGPRHAPSLSPTRSCHSQGPRGRAPPCPVYAGQATHTCMCQKASTATTMAVVVRPWPLRQLNTKPVPGSLARAARRASSSRSKSWVGGPGSESGSGHSRLKTSDAAHPSRWQPQSSFPGTAGRALCQPHNLRAHSSAPVGTHGAATAPCPRPRARRESARTHARTRTHAHARTRTHTVSLYYL